MGAVSTFTAGNYHCKPLMTDVIVIHNLTNDNKCNLHGDPSETVKTKKSFDMEMLIK